MIFRRNVEDITRLTQELKKDQNAWEAGDWKMNEMVEKWWQQMLDQQKVVEAKKQKANIEELGNKADAMNTIAEARKSFLDQKSKLIDKNIVDSEIDHEHQKLKLDVFTDQNELNISFAGLENEWAKRKEQLMDSRTQLNILQNERLTRLVNLGEDFVSADEVPENAGAFTSEILTSRITNDGSFADSLRALDVNSGIPTAAELMQDRLSPHRVSFQDL